MLISKPKAQLSVELLLSFAVFISILLYLINALIHSSSILSSAGFFADIKAKEISLIWSECKINGQSFSINNVEIYEIDNRYFIKYHGKFREIKIIESKEGGYV